MHDTKSTRKFEASSSVGSERGAVNSFQVAADPGRILFELMLWILRSLTKSYIV